MSFRKSIISELRDAIAAGEYKPGERLTEMRLANRFRVSRTPIREALHQLEKEGFVHVTPCAGARVVNLSQKNILDIYDILIAVDGLASRVAAYQITEDQLRKLEEYQMIMLEAIRVSNRELISEINIQFHWLITRATENSYLIDIRGNLCGLVDRFARISHLIPEQSEATISEHRKIIDAFRQRNPTLAEFLTKEHLERAKKRLFEFLREKQETG